MSAAAKNIMSFPEVSRYKPETAELFVPMAGDDAQPWVLELRQQGMEQLKRMGLPTPKLERWKYTNLPALVKGFGAELSAADLVYEDTDNCVEKLRTLLADAPVWLREALSATLPREDIYGDMALWHLGNAYLHDGLVIDVPAGKAAKPVSITVRGHEDSFFALRKVIRLGEGAELTIIEHHIGKGRYWNNALTQIHVGANAKLRHYRIQENSEQAVYTQNTTIACDRDATYEGFTLTMGSGLSRNQVHADMKGENATCDLYALNLLGGSQHGDTTIEIAHNVPHCTSHQFVRSVLKDQAHGVFQGKAYVAQGADKTDAQQLSNALLLNEGAEMDTKPELEIYADDVQCAHGATTGRLADEPLFYLRTRGLSEEQARMLLIEAFVGEVVDKLADETVKDLVGQKIQNWLDTPPSQHGRGDEWGRENAS